MAKNHEKRRIQIGEKTTAQERGFILKPSRERFIEQSAHNRVGGGVASYAIPVRRASALPVTSFRFHLAMDTLAVRLAVPPVGPAEDLRLQVGAPLPGAQKEGEGVFAFPFTKCRKILGLYDYNNAVISVAYNYGQ